MKIVLFDLNVSFTISMFTTNIDYSIMFEHIYWFDAWFKVEKSRHQLKIIYWEIQEYYQWRKMLCHKNINICQNSGIYRVMRHQYKINFKYYIYICEIGEVVISKPVFEFAPFNDIYFLIYW